MGLAMNSTSPTPPRTSTSSPCLFSQCRRYRVGEATPPSTPLAAPAGRRPDQSKSRFFKRTPPRRHSLGPARPAIPPLPGLELRASITIVGTLEGSCRPAVSRCPSWVTGSKTPSEYIFPELPQVADIARSAFHDLTIPLVSQITAFWVQASRLSSTQKMPRDHPE